jgi:hypothetical protein
MPTDMPSTQQTIEYRPINALVPSARNARTHTAKQVAQIVALVREYGWTNPVLADAEGIVAGHGRVLAAAELYARGEAIRLPSGEALPAGTVPVLDCTGWSPTQRRAYVIADNAVALQAGWDEALLRLEMAELTEAGVDLGLLAFDASQLAALVTPEDDTQPNPDDEAANAIPEAPPVPVVQAGEVWLLGRHRLVCGDCRDPSTVDALVAGTTINLAFTSPPYAKQRDYDADSGFTPIPPESYVEWFAAVAANVQRVLASDGSWFVNIKPAAAGLDTDLYVFDLVLAHARRWGWHFATEFCWERGGVPKAVTQRFKNQFEPVYQFVLGRWKMRPEAVRHASDNVPTAYGPGAGDTSWKTRQGTDTETFGPTRKRKHGSSETSSKMQRTNNQPAEYIGPGLAFPGNRIPSFSHTHEALGHAAAFPVGLPEFFCKAYTDEGDAVLDPFMGSGSTFIACERTARRGFGVELSPSYCDIIITRWQTYTGEAATRERDGLSYDAACAGMRPKRRTVAKAV